MTETPRQPGPDHPAPGQLPDAPAGISQASWSAPPTAAPATNPALGIAIALAIAVIGAVIWSVLAAVSGYELSLLAVLVGIGVGTALARFARPSQELAVGAVVLTVVSVIVGHVVGAWARASHDSGFGFSYVRARISVGDIMRHDTGGLFWLFLILGAFYAFSAATGRRRFGRGGGGFGGFGGFGGRAAGRR